MKKALLSILIVLLIAVVTIISQPMVFNNSYSINRKEDQCRKESGTTEAIAESLVNGQGDCRITNMGSFNNESFVSLSCKTEHGETSSLKLFGSKEACNAYKKLNSVEYIQLMLQTMLPPNTAPN